MNGYDEPTTVEGAATHCRGAAAAAAGTATLRTSWLSEKIDFFFQLFFSLQYR